MNEMTLTLNSPLTEEQWDAITDVDFDHTDRIFFHTKHGKEVEFAKVVRCKDCKRWNTVVDREKAEYGLCQIRTQLEATKKNDWCSRAERGTDE